MDGEFKSKKIDKLKRNSEKYAKKVGIKLNPDVNTVDMVVKGLLKNKKEHGDIYCPCRIVTGDKKKDKEIVCPCVFHRGEIELEGHCKCLLFVS